MLGYVTSAVQLGFIGGALLFAILLVADRFSPRKLFFCCALAGALANVALLAALLLLERIGTEGVDPRRRERPAGHHRRIPVDGNTRTQGRGLPLHFTLQLRS